MNVLNNDEAFMKHLMETFKIEADEHINAVVKALVELEKTDGGADSSAIVETLYREIHSLKGAARSVNFKAIEVVCQEMESVVNQIKKKPVSLTEAFFDILHETVDFLTDTLINGDGDANPDVKVRETSIISHLTKARTVHIHEDVPSPSPAPLDNALDSMSIVMEESAPTPHDSQLPAEIAPNHEAVSVRSSGSAANDTIRVSASRLSSILLQSEEMLSAKLSAAQRVRETKEIASGCVHWRKEWAKISGVLHELESDIQADALRNGMQMRSVSKLIEFLEWNSVYMHDTEAALRNLYKTAEGDCLVLEGMVDTLLDDMKKITMFPFSTLFEIVPKLVRDLSKDSGRKTELELNGSEIEIDRRILDEMRDPLIHLIRNCIDHGIEKPDERVKKGKSEKGKLTITVVPKDHQVELVIADDGSGISAAQVRGSMQKSGMLQGRGAFEVSDQELISYVFHSGVSTSPIINDLSGRGLGLSIVREKVEKLGGRITLETQQDHGTKFRIMLPLTIATFRGILISSGGQDFIMPTMYVERVLRISKDDVETVENREVITLNGLPLSLVSLENVLHSGDADPQNGSFLTVVVLASIGKRVAFIVDRVNHEQEILFKSLGPQLTRVRNITGATVLGSGNVIPILNVPDLISAATADGIVSAPVWNESNGVTDANAVHRVLVVEDSITTRTLLKNILEAVGYDVNTATDGQDALSKLKTNKYDIVISDVEMPKVNGFELTDSIRKNNRTKELPVILITALASEEDRERGIDAGANAYIVKGMFDQTNLLDVIKRLIIPEA